MNRRKFLIALSAIPVAAIVVVDRTTKAAKVTHVMHDQRTANEIAKMRVGDSMRNGILTRGDHTIDAYRYVIGYNDTIRAKYRRALSAALRERVDNMVFERFSS